MPQQRSKITNFQKEHSLLWRWGKCGKGHLINEENVYAARPGSQYQVLRCRTCIRDTWDRKYAANRERYKIMRALREARNATRT